MTHTIAVHHSTTHRLCYHHKHARRIIISTIWRFDAKLKSSKLVATSIINNPIIAVGYDNTNHSALDWVIHKILTRSDLILPTILRRVLIAMGLQVLQQATGINPVFNYGGMIFEEMIGDGVLAGLILSLVNFSSTIPAMRWVDTSGRRHLLLIGAVGMFIGHAFWAIIYTAGCGEESGCGSVAGLLMIASTCFFIFNFAISWGPVCWIYPSEIFPLNVRAKAVSLATVANRCMGVLMMFIPKLFPYLHINGVFFTFTGLCATCGIFVYNYCPETKGLMLEDIEALFNRNTQGNVYASKDSPAIMEFEEA